MESEKINLPSKCIVTDVTNDCPQNSSEKPMSKTVQITKFHISGCGIRHICVIWGNEPPEEHLEHEWDNPEVNMWCSLAYERVISPFFFDEDIITSNSFLDMLEYYVLPQLNNNLILQLAVHLFILLTLSMTV
jgi:hypothetical protein